MNKWLTVGCMALASVISLADTTFGGLKQAGMAGAGLALPWTPGLSAKLNPAHYAHLGKGTKFWTGGIGYELTGLSFGDLRDLTKDTGNSGVSQDTAVTLGRKFSDDKKHLGASAQLLGVSFAGFAVSFGGALTVTSVPSKTLKQWAASGGSSDTIPLDSGLDAYGFGYYSLDFGYGQELSVKRGKLSVGGQVRSIKGYYSHYVPNGTNLNSNTSVSNIPKGVEMGGQDFLTNRATAFDLGVNFELPKSAKGTTFAGLVIQNLGEPDLGFKYTKSYDEFKTDRDLYELKPFKRQVNAGVAHVSGATTLAVDYIDIGNKASSSSLRLGANFAMKGFELRAGYDTVSKGVVGFTVGGLSVAFSKTNPFSLGLNLPF